MPSSRHPLRHGLAAALIAQGLAMAAMGAELRGQIRLSDSGKNTAEARFAVVYFTPDAEVAAPKPPADPFEVVTVRKQFQPRVQAIPVGSTVEFPNADAILHNVFSLSPGHRFDLGLFGKNKSASHTFERPGTVRVFCNVHHAMVAYILVMETPYYTSPDPSGNFVLSGLPEGSGTLTVWHERTEALTRKLTLPSAQALDLELKVTKPRIPQHRNKHGKRYTRRRRGAY